MLKKCIFFVILIAMSYFFGIVPCMAVPTTQEGNSNSQYPSSRGSISPNLGSTSNNQYAYELQKLQQQVENLKKEVEFKDQCARWEVDKKFYPFYGFGFLLTIFGVSSVWKVWKVRDWAAQKAQDLIDQAMYKVDPTYIPVRIPSETTKQHLKWMGFKNVKVYDHFNPTDCKSGCVVFEINNEDDINTFRIFIKEEKPEPSKVGYILFTRERIPSDIMDSFPNLTCSNSLATLGNAILMIARVLVCTNKKED